MVVTQTLNQIQKEKRTQLNEIEAKEILKEIGIPVTETKLARTKKEALSISKRIGFPVVLKIVSPDV